MTMRDAANSMLVKRAISPQQAADNTPRISQIIDRQGFNSLTFVILTGALTDADATFTTLLEESDLPGFVPSNPVSNNDMISQDPAQLPLAAASFIFSDPDEVRKVGYVGSKRYTRLTITPANNTSAANFGAVAILERPALTPVVQTQS